MSFPAADNPSLTEGASSLELAASAFGSDRMLALAAMQRARRKEALRLYRPRPEVEHGFHRSRAKVRIIRGGNRSGKSIASAAEFASAATGIPLLGADGQPIPSRWPKTPLRLWVLGYDLKHIGQTIYRLLFQPQVFKIIRDAQTGEWRSWRPWEAEDAAREGEAEFAPPFIPERLIDPNGWSWENKGDRTFNACRLKNGNEIFAFGSRSSAKQGDPVDGIWIDEDIEDPRHVAELMLRTVDRKGCLWWSAMPHERNDALIKFSDTAAMELGKATPDVTEVQLTFSGNPFIAQTEKDSTLKLLDENERRRRDRGDFDKEGRLVFPAFSDSLHGMDQAEFQDRYDGGKNWCRYMAVDPGWAHCAATFWAVSHPDIFPQIVLLEDEIYLHNAGSREFANAVYGRIGNHVYQSFIIDDHGSRQTEMGSGRTVRAQYSEQLKRLQLRSVATGYDFEPGSDNKAYRILCFRQWLNGGEDGAPTFRFLRQRTPNFQMEIARYRRKMVNGMTTDEPDDRHFSHLMVTAQYFAAAMHQEGRVMWQHPPANVPRPKSPADLYLDAKRKRRGAGRKTYVNLGPEEDATSQFQFV